MERKITFGDVNDFALNSQSFSCKIRDSKDDLKSGENMKKPSLIGILYRPTEEFRKLKDQPVFGTALLLVLALVTIISAITGMVVSSSPAKFEELTNQYPLTPEQFQAIQKSLPFVYAFGSLSFAILIILFFSFLTWIFARIFKSKTTFKQMFSLCSHVSVVLVFLILSEFLLIVAGVSKTIPHLSLGAILPVSGKIQDFLDSFELFTLWGYALLAIGLREIAELPPAKAWSTVGILFLLINLPKLF
jgi:hypothetical protein